MDSALAHRPSVHLLCSGSFIQERAELGAYITAVPLAPLGFDREAQFAVAYVKEVLRAPVDEPSFNALRAQGDKAFPGMSIVARNRIDSAPEELERVAMPLLEHARGILSVVTGEVPAPFAIVTATETNTFFRLLPPHSRARLRLGFGNTGADFHGQLRRLMKCAGEDERFAFALSLYREALREVHPEFRVARLFSCLEALAYRIKDEKGSRQRVRILLGLENGAKTNVQIEGKNLTYDRVEIAGRIRQKLFHGAPFRPAKDLNPEAAAAYEHMRKHPEMLRDILLADCELEFARWANGASRGQRE